MKILINRENSISLTTVFIYFTLFLLTLSFQLPAGYTEDIIVVKTRSIPNGEQILEGFKNICDSSINIKEYDMQGKLKEGKRIIKRIKESIKLKQPKVVLTIGGPATKLIKESIKEIPVLFSMVVNPQKKGFTGNNISGITSDVPIKLQLEKLKEIVPGMKSIGVIYDPKNTDNIIEEAKLATHDVGLKFVVYKVSSQKEVPRALRSIIEEVNALLIITDSTVVSKNSFKYLITTTLENKIPTMVYTDYLVKAGFLVSLTPDYFSIGEQAGYVVCNLQESESNKQLSIISPQKTNLTINLKTAKRLGLNISQNILATAKVYK